MDEVEKYLGPPIEHIQQRLLYSARGVGRLLVNTAQGVIDRGHSLVGQERYDVLSKAANINSVNGCMTRRGLFNSLDALLETDRPDELLITYVDAINFKGINDKFGQNTGDLALAITGWGLREIFRSKDNSHSDAMVGSWGGDEFMCVLPVETKMNQDAFSNSLEFRYNNHSQSGTVTWYFREFLEGLQGEGAPPETMSVLSGVKRLVGQGVDSISYRYTFDVATIKSEDSARDIIDSFTETNTVKTATYLRSRTRPVQNSYTD